MEKVTKTACDGNIGDHNYCKLIKRCKRRPVDPVPILLQVDTVSPLAPVIADGDFNVQRDAKLYDF